MAENAQGFLTSLRRSVSCLLTSRFFPNFHCKAELVSYMILCFAKMPFTPPMSIARSELVLKGKPNDPSSIATARKTKGPKADKGNSVKERMSLNLKHLGTKSTPRNHQPAAKGGVGIGMRASKGDCLLPSSHTGNFPTSSSGDLISKTRQHNHLNQSPVKREHEGKMKTGKEEEAQFTLTLTPEVVLLLRRRNSERRQRSASCKPEGGTDASGNITDARRRRENAPKRNQPATQKPAMQNSRATVKHNKDAEMGDISSILKISLLNEHHRYDDVEYEEENYGLDEHVVLKCTEWLRGLEHTT